MSISPLMVTMLAVVEDFFVWPIGIDKYFKVYIFGQFG